MRKGCGGRVEVEVEGTTALSVNTGTTGGITFVGVTSGRVEEVVFVVAGGGGGRVGGGPGPGGGMGVGVGIGLLAVGGVDV